MLVPLPDLPALELEQSGIEALPQSTTQAGQLVPVVQFQELLASHVLTVLVPTKPGRLQV